MGNLVIKRPSIPGFIFQVAQIPFNGLDDIRAGHPGLRSSQGATFRHYRYPKDSCICVACPMRFHEIDAQYVGFSRPATNSSQ